MNEDYLEREPDEPENWQSNMIYRRNAQGEVEMIVVPDDTGEVDVDAGDN